ncbi:MAG: hypothetical protein ACP5LN_11110 [Thermoproteota archaeon]
MDLLITKKNYATATLILLALIVISSCYLFFSQNKLTYDSSEFIIFVRTNGTVRNLELTVRFCNLSYSKFEDIYEKSLKARVASYYGPQYVTVSIDEINSDEPVLIKISSLSPVGNLSFNAVAPLFYSEDYLSKIPHNVTEIGLYSAIYAKGMFGMKVRFASYWILGKVSNSKIQWSSFCSRKTTVLSACNSLNVIAIAFAVVFAISYYKKREFRPWLTFVFTLAMVVIYIFIGTSMDFLIHNYSKLSLVLLSLFSFLFHSCYEHLFSNITVFIVSGACIEYWLRSAKLKYRLFWFLFPALISSIFSLYLLISFPWPSVGASYWIIGQSLTSFLYIVRNYGNKEKVNLTSTDLMFLLLSGFCIISSTYAYFAVLFFFSFDEVSKNLALGHILFLTLFFIVFLILHKYANKFRFLHEAIKELGAET